MGLNNTIANCYGNYGRTKEKEFPTIITQLLHDKEVQTF